MAEARPFLTDLINFIQPEAILFGGDSGVQFFSDAHGGKLTTGSAIWGPNGSNDAVYFREYQLGLPFYRTVPAYGIYHPSKLNAVFERRVLPILKERLGPLVTQ
ncbi:MAG: hypothetical protein M3Q08_18680 [Pseudomonadota bacterium]|nr:hypothetical protein [Pseudomonadota bacterium]